MCGIVGIAGDLDWKDEKLMKALLLNDYFRGPDSTGFASITKNDEARIAKVSSHPFALFDMKSFNSALSFTTSKVFLGHNRAATRGRITDTNTHPFHIDHIVGCHNGTLEFNEWRDLETAVDEKFGTDSAALIAGIARLGVKTTIEMCRGAWSLVWIDLKANTLNFLRNSDRPMYLAHSKDFKKLLWSSEWKILAASIMMTDGYSASDDLDHGPKNKPSTYTATEIDTHYTFDLEELEKSGKKVKPRARTIKGKEAVAWTGAKHNPFSLVDGAIDPNSPITGTMPGLPGPVKGNTTQNPNTTHSDKIHEQVTHLFSIQPFAGLIAKDKFDELNRHGCSWCGNNDFEWEDEGWLVIERQEAIICPDCTKERKNKILAEKELYL